MFSRKFTAPCFNDRCTAHAKTAVKGEGAQCMRKAWKNGLCKQHHKLQNNEKAA